MATVVDVARTNGTKTAHAVAYQKGNSDANTPSPTWEQTINFLTAATIETHIPTRSDVVPAVGVDNTADTWLPAMEFLFLPSVPNTVRF